MAETWTASESQSYDEPEDHVHHSCVALSSPAAAATCDDAEAGPQLPARVATVWLRFAVTAACGATQPPS
eukprot:13812628-Alexandrium_andersonii.AAC.1